MQPAQSAAILSALRTLAAAIGGVLVARGLISEDTLTQILGAASVLGPIAWGVIDKFRAESRTQARIGDAVTSATGAP